MITTVASVALPVDEELKIQKNRIEPENGAGSKKRISVVTGIHGDELEGQYVCFELIRRINAQKENPCRALCEAAVAGFRRLRWI